MLTYVYAYYDNPQMLAHQYKVWDEYGWDLKRQLEFIVVDDASPRWPAANVERPAGLLDRLSIYRVKHDIPWHQDGARNLGAKKAKGPWLFLSDMDHILQGPAAIQLCSLLKNAQPYRQYYTFARHETNGEPTLKNGQPKYGPNILCMSKDLYWFVGGYDEDLCGWYGSDGMWRRRLDQNAKREHLKWIPVTRVSREEIPDASTTTLQRKGRENDLKKVEVLQAKKRKGRLNKITTLDFEWERVV